jgi:hypothetical protein
MAPPRQSIEQRQNRESAVLRTHWVLVVMDHCTRRIVGFAVHRVSSGKARSVVTPNRWCGMKVR